MKKDTDRTNKTKDFNKQVKNLDDPKSLDPYYYLLKYITFFECHPCEPDKPCGRLECRRCGPRKLRRYIQRITEIAQHNNLNRFITLTMPTGRWGLTNIPKLRKGFQKLRTAYKNKYGEKLNVIWVMGRSKSSAFHIHFITDVDLDRGWLKKTWHRYTGGQQVDMRPVRHIPATAQYLILNYLQSHPGYKGSRIGRRIGSSRELGLKLNGVYQHESK